MAMSNIAPIAPETISSSPSTLVIKEKKLSITGDSGKITDADGNVVFQVDAHYATFSQRRTLKDAAGKEIGQIRRRKTPGFHSAMRIGTMDDEKKCLVKTKGTFNPLNSNADIYVGDEVVGEASGNWRAKSYEIKLQGEKVASVYRKTGITGYVFGTDSYMVDIVPGMDVAFLCLVTIALDELYHDNSSSLI